MTRRIIEADIIAATDATTFAPVTHQGGDGRVSLAPATAEQAGLMSAADKAALNGVSDPAAILREWTATEAYTVTSATYGSSGALTSAVVAWPDGGTGALTVTQTNAALGAVNGYNVTHAGFGLRATQPPVTRNSLGNITAQPAITVGAI